MGSVSSKPAKTGLFKRAKTKPDPSSSSKPDPPSSSSKPAKTGFFKRAKTKPDPASSSETDPSSSSRPDPPSSSSKPAKTWFFKRAKTKLDPLSSSKPDPSPVLGTGHRPPPSSQYNAPALDSHSRSKSVHLPSQPERSPPPPPPALNSRSKSKSVHPPPLPALSSHSKSTSAHLPSEPEMPLPLPRQTSSNLSKSTSTHPPSGPEISPPPPALNSRSKSRSAYPLSEPEMSPPLPPLPLALSSHSNSTSAHLPSKLEMPPPPPPPALSGRSKSMSAHPPSEPEMSPPLPPLPLALSSHSNSTSAHPPSKPEMPPPPPLPALSSRSKSTSAHPPSELEIPLPPPPPALNSRSKSKSAHPPSGPEMPPPPPPPPPPPALGSRSKSTSPHPPSRPGIPPPPPPLALNSRSKSRSSHPPSESEIPLPDVGPRAECVSRTNPKSAPGRRGEFTSTVRTVLPDNFRFRILVVGKSDSGKSSLINSIFKVETAPTSANADINVGFPHPDNGRLIVHECPGFEPGSAQNFPSIREFITRRTKADLSQSERLHTIWVCVPTVDLIDGTLGDGVEEILSIRNVPVVLVFTKFDRLVSNILFDTEGGDSQQHERAKVEAERKYAESCHLLLRKQPRDVPAEIVSTNPGLSDLISKLFATTHRLVVADSVNATVVSTSFEAQGEKIQNPPVSLAWSIAQRVSRDANLHASIVVGKSRYWRSPRSSDKFPRRTLEECTEVIHSDIADVWNLRDKNKYLSTPEFKTQMSHLVRDLAEPLAGVPPGLNGAQRAESATPAEQWVKNLYQNTAENICCIMGYIVDLTVIQHELFQSGRDVSAEEVQSVIDGHNRSGRWCQIHGKIREFVTETVKGSYITSDQLADGRFLQGTIELIDKYCNSQMAREVGWRL